MQPWQCNSNDLGIVLHGDTHALQSDGKGKAEEGAVVYVNLDIIRQQRHLITPKRSKVLPKSFTDTGNNKNCEEEHANNDNEVKVTHRYKITIKKSE